MKYSFLRFVVVVISLAVVATVSADDAFADKAKILQNENAAGKFVFYSVLFCSILQMHE